ncbi:N-acyl-D-amino-acid deacylase family protein [Ruegeria marina]|uniref:N-acyl-D-amino-acid deacylase n=1 Tax=Ruegeria marina TaxID=639004 RepID=A0A1G7EUL9_9RHOB|nr:D-aminoacylase [Ruegeria marina]SDE67216.1 N-acyl-D-amino-acid deacylase [Ruegeria marina]
MNTADLILRNARLIDGTGSASCTGDLAITDDRITGLGDLGTWHAAQEIDALGLALAPGFIDSHCHDDLALLQTPLLEPKISQGVTTVVNGNCGFSLAPHPEGRGPLPQPLASLVPDQSLMFPDFAAYFQRLSDQPASVNSLCLCGHTTLRHAVMDRFDRAATPAEIKAMRDLLDKALAQGAAGMSTGLYYPPASAAPTEEVIEIGAVLQAYQALYVTHMRNEADGVVASVEETLRIGHETGVPAIVSHHKCMNPQNHGKSKITLGLIDAALAAGQDVGLDAYPYIAGSTFLFPERVEQAARVIVTWSKAMPETSGRDLTEIAAELGLSLREAAERLLPAGAVYFQMDECDLRRILSHPLTMIGSDGLVADPHPHPRAWGTFPRVLGHYARDEGLFPLEEAVHRMTGLTAKRFGLAGRGVLQVGAFADLVLFDPAAIHDSARFEDPQRPAAGLHGVWCNGRLTWNGHAATGNRPGRVLTRSS